MSKPDSAFLFVEVAAKRCLQLMRGARPKIDSNACKYSTLAIQEVDAGEVPWEVRDPEAAELVAAGLSEPVEKEKSAEEE
jgi:DNA-directed RNA polymerase subunit K/omega